MTLLVIGRNGQLARALVEAAARRGIALAARGRPDCDLTKPESLAAAIDEVHPDLVINAAAYTAVDKAEAERDLAFAVNSQGPGLLARLCAERALPLVHISTDYVFDGSKTAPYVESDPTAPLGVYGRSKREGERRVAVGNPRHVILRTAWVYSPFGTNFLKTMLRLAAKRERLAIVGDQIGNPTYAAHLAEAIVTMAPRLTKAGAGAPLWGTFHASASGEASWFDFAGAIFAEAAHHGVSPPILERITTADYPTPAQRPANSRLDCARLKAVFGVRLPDWREGVRACVKRVLERDNGQGGQ